MPAQSIWSVRQHSPLWSHWSTALQSSPWIAWPCWHCSLAKQAMQSFWWPSAKFASLHARWRLLLNRLSAICSSEKSLWSPLSRRGYRECQSGIRAGRHLWKWRGCQGWSMGESEIAGPVGKGALWLGGEGFDLVSILFSGSLLEIQEYLQTYQPNSLTLNSIIKLTHDSTYLSL